MDGVAGDHFGISVAISGDGHTILFNANQKDNARGGAYFFSNEPVSSIYFPIIKR